MASHVGRSLNAWLPQCSTRPAQHGPSRLAQEADEAEIRDSPLIQILKRLEEEAREYPAQEVGQKSGCIRD